MLSAVYYPIEKVKLKTIDLTKISPVELTQVRIKDLFKGETRVSDGQEISYRVHNYWRDNDFTIGTVGGTMNLSSTTGSSYTWEMIVGKADQLETTNIRYIVPIETTWWGNWLEPTVYTYGTANGAWTARKIESTYTGSSSHSLEYYFKNIDRTGTVPYLKFAVNTTDYNAVSSLKVYAGSYTSAQEAQSKGEDITDRLLNANMANPQSGYAMSWINTKDVTFVSYNEAGNVTGCLPVNLELYSYTNIDSYTKGDKSLTIYPEYPCIYDTDTESYHEAAYDYDPDKKDGIIYRKYYTYKEYAYDAEMTWGISKSSDTKIKAVYVGNYDTIESAKAAGAQDITEQATASNDADRYKAIFKDGVTFSVFATDDEETLAPVVFKYNISTQQGDKSHYSDYAEVPFTGLNGADGKPVDCWFADEYDDSYAEGNFVTFFVADGTDLSHLAPTFLAGTGINFYRSGSSQPIKSGEDYADFSHGAVQYTSSARSGENAKNYWVQVEKASAGQQLFVTSLQDPSANTTTKDGVVYSTREVMFDRLHYNRHNIFVANIGTESIPNLKVELQDSTTLELDSFFTLKGNNQLEGFNELATTDQELYGETRAKNFATVKLRIKDGVTAGDANGKLVFSSNGRTLLVLTLTGAIGNPQIITDTIPTAVKYEPLRHHDPEQQQVQPQQGFLQAVLRQASGRRGTQAERRDLRRSEGKRPI